MGRQMVTTQVAVGDPAMTRVSFQYLCNLMISDHVHCCFMNFTPKYKFDMWQPELSGFEEVVESLVRQKTRR